MSINAMVFWCLITAVFVPFVMPPIFTRICLGVTR